MDPQSRHVYGRDNQNSARKGSKMARFWPKWRYNGRVMAREVSFYQCLWVTKFWDKFGCSWTPRTARAPNSFIVLRCMWKEPAPIDYRSILVDSGSIVKWYSGTMLMNDIHIGSENGNHTTRQSNLDSCKNKQQFKTLPILVWKASHILQVLETKIECFKSCTMVQCKVFCASTMTMTPV